jgi:predicted molibdopterin-dependent oxidoreductase YjgC
LSAIRIAEDFRPGDLVVFDVNGETATGCEGEMLAAALLALGRAVFRHSPRDGAPRGAFCLMGVCQECLVHVDGALQQACQVSLRPGMKVELRGAV